MTRNPAPRRLAGLTALLVALPAVALAAAPTTSAWTDDAHVGASASAGTWETEPTGPTGPTGPVVGCAVYDTGTGAKVRDCTITTLALAAAPWGPTGALTAQYSILISGHAGGGERTVVTVDLRQATGHALPGGWDWSVAGAKNGWNGVVVSPCADLPLLTLEAPAYQGDIGVQVLQNRVAQGPVSCS